VTQPWLETEVHDLWTLSSEELALLPGMTDKGRLGFALQLKFMQIHGRFPEQHTEIDPNSTQWIARQLDGRQGRRHRQAIRRVLGFRPATAADFERLGHWLRAEALPYDPQAQHGTDSALESCRTQRLEPPAPEHLGRIIRSAVHRFETASPYIARDLCRFDDAMQYGFGRNHGVFIAFDDKEAGISRKPFGIAGDGRVRPICRRCL